MFPNESQHSRGDDVSVPRWLSPAWRPIFLPIVFLPQSFTFRFSKPLTTSPNILRLSACSAGNSHPCQSVASVVRKFQMSSPFPPVKFYVNNPRHPQIPSLDDQP